MSVGKVSFGKMFFGQKAENRQKNWRGFVATLKNGEEKYLKNEKSAVTLSPTKGTLRQGKHKEETEEVIYNAKSSNSTRMPYLLSPY